MRELKFRGWANRGFVYFDLREDNDFTFYDFYSCCESNSIEQYTGHEDKNGKEIYEGDIVKSDFTKRIYKVVYRRWDASFVCENDKWEEILLFINNERPSLEVIGNIHENPVLCGEVDNED